MGDTNITVGASLNWIFLQIDMPLDWSFLRMPLVPEDWVYENVGCWKLERPRWLRAVLWAVGVLIGDGETGRGKGDLGAPWATVEVGTARDSLGLAVRSMFVLDSCTMKRLNSKGCSTNRSEFSSSRNERPDQQRSRSNRLCILKRN